MPYATPGQNPPVPPSQGRPGHRRSYSHIQMALPSSSGDVSFTSTSSSLGSLPRRRSSSASATTAPTVAEPHRPATPRKFQLGRDDDDDDDSSDERDKSKKVPLSRPSSNNINDKDDEEDEDTHRRLPPLRLKVKTPSSFDAQLAVPFPRSSPRSSPMHSPTHSPSSSREGIASTLSGVYSPPAVYSPPPKGGYLNVHPGAHAMARSVSDQPAAAALSAAHPHQTQTQSNTTSNSHIVSQTPVHANTHLRPPSVSRTYSSPILLSNGKPLKSSLKGSSSSPNIPFPSQSILPSVLWPDLHRRGHSHHGGHGRHDSHAGHGHHHHHGHGGGHGHGQGPHQRAASAPSTPHLGPLSPPSNLQMQSPSPPRLASSPPASGPTSPSFSSPDSPSSLSNSLTSIDGVLSPLADADMPSLTSSISSLSSSTSTSSPSTSSPSSDSPPASPSSSYFHTHNYPHTPKNVHFPSQEGDIATVRVFNRSARPASVSLTGTGNQSGGETETETEGEGSGTGGFGGFGMGKWGVSWGSVGRNSGGITGYPFPKVATPRSHSPLAPSSSSSSVAATSSTAQSEHDSHAHLNTNTKEYYDLDYEGCSFVPMRDGAYGGAEGRAGNGHCVGEGGYVYVESVGFVRPFSSGGGGSSSNIKNLPPARPLTLTGTILVRNLAYQKTVAVRFTMDEWHTTNDVLATYECSLAGLPEGFFRKDKERVGVPWGLDSAGAGMKSTAGAAWDRFRFTINLEDYASSGTLENRTMWFVTRYTAGVDVRVRAASLGSSPSSVSSLSSLGLGGKGGGVEVEMLKELHTSQEWWDNNAGRNYRIAFAKVVPSSSSSVAATRAATTATANGHGGGVYKRGVILSAPSAYPPSSSPPTQGSKSYPAPPQISGSVSFPGPQGAYSSLSSNSTPQQLQQQKEHQAALTQSTLARLKKLNLRNYAAPAGYPSPISPSASGSAPVIEHSASPVTTTTTAPNATATTSRDSTPVQTPRDDVRAVLPDVDDHQEVDKDRTPTFKGAIAPSWGVNHPGSTGMGKDSLGTTAAMALQEPPTKSMAIDASKKEEYLGELGTSPPFSAMGDMDMGMGVRVPASRVLSGAGAGAGGIGGQGGGGDGYWSWGSFGDVPAPVPAPVSADIPEKAPVAIEEMLMDIKERSTSATTNASNDASRPLAPPQRKRKESLGHVRQGASAEGEHKATFSIGTKSPSNSNSNSSGSGSDSGSGTRARAGAKGGNERRAMSPVYLNGNGNANINISTQSAKGNGNGSGPAMWGIRPGSPRPVGSGYRSPSSISPSPSPPPSSPSLTASGLRGSTRLSGTRSPMRVSPLASPSISPNASSLGFGFGFGAAAGAGSSPSPLSNSNNNSGSDNSAPTSPGAGGTDDAVYQAFVRQWCFAQAPGPTVGSSAVDGGPGAGGKEGSRLIVG